MKKLFSTLLIGCIGGATFFVAEQFISKNESKSLVNNIESYSPPARIVNYDPLAGNAIDFSAAAEISVNAVVHIKTTIDRT